MQIGIRLHDSAKAPLEERLKTVKAQGFSCAHIALSKLFDDKKYSATTALTPGYAMYLKKLFEANGLDIAVLGCYLNLANPNPEKLKEIKHKYEANIRFASVLGAGVVGTETGAPNEEYKYEPACRSREALESFIGGLEPVAKHIVYDEKRAREVLKAIASPNLRIILDAVNLLDMDNYLNQKDVVKRAIDELHEEIAVVHIKDFIVENESLVSVGAGNGRMDYDELLTFIAKEKPFIHATLENTTPESAEKSREFIEEKYRNFCE
jgi:sugar phosphate isomerase/epimerase